MNSENGHIVLDREKLRDGKYTRGLEKLTSDQLHGLLWLVGEWAVRCDNDHPRSVAAKKAILNFFHDPLTLEEVYALMRGEPRSRP